MNCRSMTRRPAGESPAAYARSVRPHSSRIRIWRDSTQLSDPNRMIDTIGHEAAIPNPALVPLSFLVGEWSTEGSHPLLPGKVRRGRTGFAWLDGGAFLVIGSEMDEPEIPSGIAILGTEGDAKEWRMLN